MSSRTQFHFRILLMTFILYISYCFIVIFVFPDQYFVSDFNMRIVSMVIEIIVLVSLIYSVWTQRTKLSVFWLSNTIAVSCLLLGNLVSAFQILDIKLPIKNFNISDVFFIFFVLFFLFSFFYKIMKECNKWEKAYLICDLCIVISVIFTLEWYLFNKQTIDVFSLSIGDTLLTFILPIIDLLFLLLGISLIFRPAIFNAKSKLYIFIFVLIGFAITDYLYFYLYYDLSNRTILLLRCLYRVLILLIAIAATISKDLPSKKDYYVVDPIFGKKILVIFPYLAVLILIAFTLKEQTSSAILIWGNCIAFIFVLIRHTIVRMQNENLTNKIKVFNSKLEKKVTSRTLDLVRKSNDLVQNQREFQSLYEYHPDPIFTIDLNGTFLNVNHAGQVILGSPIEELINKDCLSIIIDEDKYKLELAIKQANRCKPSSFQLRSHFSKGNDIHFWYVTIVPIIIEGQAFGSYLMVKDITKIKQQQEEINYLAFHDTVTEVGNRIFFQKELEKFIEHSSSSNTTFSLFYIDLNRFKNINDTYGHSTGDCVLKEIAKRFSTCLSSDVTIARIGGDEFCVLINSGTEQLILDLCNSLFHATKDPIIVNKNSFYLSISIGIAIYPFGGTSAMELLQHADIAMYDAKKKGGNAVSIYDELLSNKVKRRLRLEKDLTNAIENEELFLLYQPQIDSKSGKVIGVEALIRWKHPELGTISPHEFIPIAEETRQIISIGKWTLQKSCQQLKYWHVIGYSNLKIGVNLSAIEFEQKDFVQTIISTIEITGIPASSLDLELTERIAMADEKETLSKLRVLKSFGVNLSIDDFGTGYSSLAYLPLYPIDTLKIPREFINMIETSNDGSEIINTIISLANTLKMKVVAEGVETRRQLELLKSNKCYLIQGYYYSKPLNEREFIKFLKVR